MSTKRIATKPKQKSLETRVRQLEAWAAETMQSLDAYKQALNATSMILAQVDGFLSKTSPGWDGGFKERLQKRAADIQRYREILSTISESDNSSQLNSLADELWAVAGRLGIEANEAPRVAAIYLQCSNLNGCRRILRHIVDDSGQLIEGVDPTLFEMLEARCAELENNN